jgi:metal-responsive CopG/Arc/MetJ family transcriptional regulator
MNLVAKANDTSVRVRVPRKVLRELDLAAAQAGRSRNSEIIYRLKQSLLDQQPQSASQPA